MVLPPAVITFTGGIMTTHHGAGKSKNHGWFSKFSDRWQLSRKTGELVRRILHISRRDNLYEETVIGQDGRVIHECREPLTEHRGHGSAKPQP